jgi:signal transduction histidine kinase
MTMISTAPMPAKVLVVDDSPANLVALGAVLKPLNVPVVEARSGAAALEHVAHETFAVILLDVQMPEMDGFEVAKRLRALPAGAELPVIFLTAIHRDEMYVKQGYGTGAADYITKPYDADMLRARVKAFVELFNQREQVRVEQVRRRTRERDDALEQLSDLLERERTARHEAELANRAKDEFLATVSHELRTPLNAILGWSVLARDMTQDAQVHRALATIERNARSQMRIIEDVLDIGRIISGKLRLEIVDARVDDTVLGAVEAVRPAAAAKDVDLTVDIAPDVGVIRADADRLQQIVWNVLSNAIKFTPKRGRVSLQVVRKGQMVHFRVSDDGQGIAPEFIPFLFDAFKQADGSTTRRHGGLGLGLAIVKQLVHAHGGEVWATSAGVGHGATFTIPLPTREPTGMIASTPPPPHPTRRALDGLTVLVVEDDEDARGLLEHALKSFGAGIVMAPSANEALARLKEQRVDVILSDISMPEVDGYSLIRSIRKLAADRGGATPAIALTAHASHDFVQAALDSGFQAHLAKPIDMDALVSTVTKVCSAS